MPFRYKDDAIYDITILDSEQGLPNPFVRAIGSDTNGVMWFGMHNGGLISYDGYYFDEYEMRIEDSRELTYSMLIDSKGNIWTGTNNGAICFDGEKITRYNMKQGLPSNYVVAFIEDSNNDIWLATLNGVSRFDGETITTYSTSSGLAAEYVFSLFEDYDGNIWFATLGGGVQKFDGKSFTTFTEDDGLASDYVLSIVQDHQGNQWFGTNGGGVSKFDGKTFTNYSTEQGLGSNDILSIIEDKDNNMWFGSYGNGISRFNRKSFSTYTTKEGLSDNYLRTIFKDRIGNIWIGTDVGITKFNRGSFVNFTEAHGLINHNITTVFQDNMGRIWIAYHNAGISILTEPKDAEHKTKILHITEEQGLAYNTVTSIIQDSQNNFWFGTYGNGVSMLDGEDFEKGKLNFTNYSLEQGMNSKHVNEILQDNAGDIWFSTDNGVIKFDGEGFVNITNANGLIVNKISCVFQDRSEALWFGSMDGGVSYFYNDTLINYTSDQGLGNNRIGVICQDQNGVMWFGTDGGGLSYFNGKSFNTFDVTDGLCNDNVFSLTLDENNSIWIGTINGLSQLIIPDTIHSNKDSVWYDKPIIFSYEKLDGLKGLDFYARSAILDNKSRLWLGTEKSLTMLDLITFEAASNVPHIHLNGIAINNHTIDFKGLKYGYKTPHPEIHFSDVSKFYNNPINLSLPYDKNHITFNFSAIDWSGPHHIKYQYKLQGLEDNWSLLSKANMADYRNISPGHYTFLVKAIGKSGIWSEEFKYPFVIRRPLWLSWWALFAYVICFVLGIWLIIRWRVNIIKNQKSILEQMVARRTKDLDEALIIAKQATEAKSQFIATMSHEIRTPLNAIIGLTHLAKDNTIEKKQQDYLQKIDRSATTMLSLINDILDFSKIEGGKMQLENVPFDIGVVMNSVIVLNAQQAHEKNLDFTINIDPKIPEMLIGDPLRIGQVITNLCSNAIKFTLSGEVIINVDIANKISDDELLLQVSVQDTGIGIEKEKIAFLFDEFKQADNSITRKYGGTGLGLSISKLIIDMMGGRIWLDSEPGKGSTFFFDCILGIESKKLTSDKLNSDNLKFINILLCDDKPTALKTLSSILNSLSLNVDIVSTGEEVLISVKEKKYDLLIIDQKLSGLSGIDTIVEMNKNTISSPVKTILMTCSRTSDDYGEKDVAGISGFLSKPILPSVILEEMLTVFDFEKMSYHLEDDKDTQFERIKSAVAESKLLIVEDNELNRQVLIELIEKLGIEIELAHNGKEAVEMVLHNDFDLILMDLHMPVMDGFASSREIRMFRTDLPIIAITADAIGIVDMNCREVGINDIITKPIDPDLLYDKLLKWISPGNEIVKDAPLEKEETESVSSLSIPGLQIQSAIRRFGDNEALYRKMLRKFISGNSQTGAIVKELMVKGDFEQAHLKIHTFKGESANIGAVDINEISKKLEEHVLNKDVSKFELDLVLFNLKFEELALSVEELFSESGSETKHDLIDFKKLVLELIDSLEKRDPRVFNLLDKINEFDIKSPELGLITKAINSGKRLEAIDLLRKLVG